jgi:hypothetical protein
MSKAISEMLKKELMEELTERSVLFSSRDTVPELKVLLKEAREKDLPHSTGTKNPSITTKSKAELQALCKEEGLQMTEHATRDQMITKLKGLYRVRETPHHEDKVTFGKHDGLMYRTVKEEHPSYVTWARQTVMDGPLQAHPELVRFVKYCDLVDKGEIPPARETRTPSTARSSHETMEARIKELEKKLEEKTKQEKGTTVKQEEKTEVKPVFPPVVRQKRGATSSSSENAGMTVDQVNRVPNDPNSQGEMLNALRAIMQRMDNLEQRAASSISEKSWEKEDLL